MSTKRKLSEYLPFVLPVVGAAFLYEFSGPVNKILKNALDVGVKITDLVKDGVDGTVDVVRENPKTTAAVVTTLAVVKVYMSPAGDAFKVFYSAGSNVAPALTLCSQTFLNSVIQFGQPLKEFALQVLGSVTIAQVLQGVALGTSLYLFFELAKAHASEVDEVYAVTATLRAWYTGQLGVYSVADYESLITQVENGETPALDGPDQIVRVEPSPPIPGVALPPPPPPIMASPGPPSVPSLSAEQTVANNRELLAIEGSDDWIVVGLKVNPWSGYRDGDVFKNENVIWVGADGKQKQLMNVDDWVIVDQRRWRVKELLQQINNKDLSSSHYQIDAQGVLYKSAIPSIPGPFMPYQTADNQVITTREQDAVYKFSIAKNPYPRAYDNGLPMVITSLDPLSIPNKINYFGWRKAHGLPFDSPDTNDWVYYNNTRAVGSALPMPLAGYPLMTPSTGIQIGSYVNDLSGYELIPTVETGGGTVSGWGLGGLAGALEEGTEMMPIPVG